MRMDVHLLIPIDHIVGQLVVGASYSLESLESSYLVNISNLQGLAILYLVIIRGGTHGGSSKKTPHVTLSIPRMHIQKILPHLLVLMIMSCG